MIAVVRQFQFMMNIREMSCAAGICMLDANNPCSICESWSATTCGKLRKSLGDAKQKAAREEPRTGRANGRGATSTVQHHVECRGAAIQSMAEVPWSSQTTPYASAFMAPPAWPMYMLQNYKLNLVLTCWKPLSTDDNSPDHS